MAFEGWAIVELMGHRQRAGLVSEVEAFGTKLLQIDIHLPDESEGAATEFYGGSSIYALRPCTEEIARKMAQRIGDPRPARPLEYRLTGPSDELDDEPF